MREELSPNNSVEDTPQVRWTLRSFFVVITCLMVMIGLGVRVLQSARETARRMTCCGRLSQLGLSFHNYKFVYKHWPASFDPTSQLNWTVAIHPFIESPPAYNLISKAAGPYYASGKNDPHGLTRVAFHFCPSSTIERMELTAPSDISPLDRVPINTGAAPFTHHYYGISGARGHLSDISAPHSTASSLTFEGTPVAGNGVFQWNRVVTFQSVEDGLSNTLALGEMSWMSRRYGTRYRSWMHGGTDGSYAAGCRNIARPINAHRKGSVLTPFNDMPMGSQHPGGANFGCVDGSYRFLSEEIDMQTYQAMATIAGH